VTHHRGAYLTASATSLPQSRPASGLSLDPADVPLQRLVLSMDRRGAAGINVCLRKSSPQKFSN